MFNKMLSFLRQQKLKRKLLKMQKNHFWQKANKKHSRFINFVNKIMIAKNSLSNNFENIKTRISILKNILLSLFLSAIISVGVILFDFLFLRIPSIYIFDNSSIDALIGLLSAFIGLDGVFIAIYYSSSASIFSSKYSNSSEDIRNMFFNETVKYSDFLISNVVFLITFVIFLSMQRKITIILVAIVALSVLINMFIFSKLGRIAFALSDIFRLSAFIRDNIRKKLNQLAKQNFVTKMDEFQNSCCEYVKDQLIILSELSTSQLKDAPKESIYKICHHNLLLISFYYYSIYFRIHENSLWFDKIYESPYWFLSNFNEKGIALNNATTLMLKGKSNPNWFERNILDLNLTILKKSERADDTFYCSYIKDFSNMVGNTLLPDNTEHIIDETLKLWKVVSRFINDKRPHVKVVLAWSNLLVNLILCTNNTINYYSINALNEFTDLIFKNPYCDIKDYKKIIDFNIKKIISSLQEDQMLEGKSVASKEYIKEYLCCGFRKQLFKYSCFCRAVLNIYKETRKQLLQRCNKEELAIFDLRNKEINHRCGDVISRIVKIDHSFKNCINSGFFIVENYKYDSNCVVNENDYYEVYKNMFLLYESGFVKTKTDPDYIGYSYYNSLHDAFNSLISNDFTLYLKYLELLIDNASRIGKELFNSIKELISTKNSKLCLYFCSVCYNIIDLIGLGIYYCDLFNLRSKKRELLNLIKAKLTPNKMQSYLLNYEVYSGSKHDFFYYENASLERRTRFFNYLKGTNKIEFENNGIFMRRIKTKNKFIAAFPINESVGFNDDFSDYFIVYYFKRIVKKNSKLLDNISWSKKI